MRLWKAALAEYIAEEGFTEEGREEEKK